MSETLGFILLILFCIACASPVILGISVMTEREKEVNKQLADVKHKSKVFEENGNKVKYGYYVENPVLDDPKELYWEGCGPTWGEDKNGNRYRKILTEEQKKSILKHRPNFFEKMAEMEKEHTDIMNQIHGVTKRKSISDIESFAGMVEKRQRRINNKEPIDKDEEQKILKYMES